MSPPRPALPLVFAGNMRSLINSTTLILSPKGKFAALPVSPLLYELGCATLESHLLSLRGTQLEKHAQAQLLVTKSVPCVTSR